MTSIPDLSQLDPDQQIKRNLIARPDLRPGVLLPPVVPPPPSTQGVQGSQMPDPAPPVVAQPNISPAQSRVDFLRQSPSGISQLHPKSTIGKIGKGALQGLDFLGSTLAPGIAANIPGTTMHHNVLEAQAERQLGSDVANQEKQAETTRNVAEAKKAEADANLPVATNPDKKIDEYTNDQGQRVQVMQRPDNSTYERVGGKVEGKTVPHEDPETQFVDEYRKSNPNATIAEAQRAYAKNNRFPPQTEPGSYMPLYDKDGKVVGAWNPKNGHIAHAPELPGTTAQGEKIAQQNKPDQITPAAQTILQQTEPVKAQVEQLIQALAPYNNPNAGRLTMDRLKYALGEPSAPGELADQISKLELNRIISGARILKGSSRAYQALERAMVHAPNPWVDKPQLMYQKLQTILQNLNDVEKDAIAYGKKGQTAEDAQHHLSGGKVEMPSGATGKAKGSDGKWHWTNKSGTDLGVAD